MILFYFLAVFDYSITAGADAAYDDNVFDYAPKYLEEFMNQINPERFPFETYDDLKTKLSLNLLVRNKFIDRRTTTVSLELSNSNYLTNHAKDYSLFTAGIRQSFDKFAVKFEYLFMPRYLIRYYQDPQGTAYIGCEFAEHLWSLKCTFWLASATHISAAFKREIDNYIENFDPYDSEAYRLGIESGFELLDFLEPSMSYEFKDSKTRGPTPDISYLQHGLQAGILFRLKFPPMSKINVEYHLDYRIFTTELPPLLDSPHSGRMDLKNWFGVSWAFPVLTSLDLSLGYDYEFRNSYSDIYSNIAELKNYRKWMVSGGLRFEY